MSKKCSNFSCNRTAYALCHGCKSNFCREHMYEHSSLTHSQLNPLLNEINQINNQLKTINLPDLFHLSYQKLDQWRIKSHQIIDLYFTEKTHYLTGYLNEKLQGYQTDFQTIQNKLTTYIQDQETTHEQINFLAFEIENLRKSLNKINHQDFQIQINPLTIEENLINFDQVFNLKTLPPIYQVIDRYDECCTSLATNNRLLLLHQEDTLLLVDKELTKFKQIPWIYGSIYDMCYSSTLKQFIIITENEIFLINEQNMNMNKVRSIPWQQWFSCTCSDTSLYLSTKVYNSSLVQFNLFPSIKFIKAWTSPEICTNDEAIDGMVYKDQKLALLISNDVKRILRIELRSAITLGRIWILPLDVIYNEKQAFRFCSINHNEWLIADHANSCLLQITADGTIKTIATYYPAPCCAIQFGNNLLAISTQSVVNLHKL